MSNIKIHVLHTGAVCVSPDLPFGGDHCNAIKASGIFQPRKNRLWLPVSAYLIEHPKGLFLVDTGWARAMSPKGEFDKKAQIKSLGSLVLYEVNQGQIPLGECIDEQLAKQKQSLAWICEQSLDPLCVESLANHDPDIEPHVIEL